MPRLPSFATTTRVIAVSLFCTVFFLLFTCLAQAQLPPNEVPNDTPKTVSPRLTVHIIDEIPPSTPILIAPANNSTITDPTPSFIWQESTDEKKMGHYKLYLNGSIYFDNIPLTPTDNSQYTLTKSGNQYTLTPKNNLSDGNYTWKIRAVDAAGNYKDSATWSFKLDSTAPTFVITTIGEKTVSISAQDLSTLPNPYLEITTNEPVVAGTSEANSTILLLVEIPDQSNENYTIPVNGSGQWSITLPIYPREKIITLNFTITDPAGNVTILNGVKFLIKQQFIFATPTISPFPSPTSPAQPGEPTTTPEPGQPEPSATPVPVQPIPLPSIALPAIPVAPPREILTNILNTIIPKAVTEAIPQVVEETAKAVAPVGSALISSALPVTATALFAWQFGWGLSLQILLRILQAIGLLPTPKPQGVVFNSKTKEPVSFAILNVHRLGDSPTTETLVTSVDGVYGGLRLTPGQYRIDVTHQDFTFPTAQPTPPYLSAHEFYRGEVFEIAETQNDPLLFMIPIDPLAEVTAQTRVSVSLIRHRLIRLWHYSLWPLFVLSIGIYIFYPTIINLLVLGVYLLIIALRLVKGLKRPRIVGTVVDDMGQPLANVFVRLIEQETNQLAALLLTQQQGKFAGFVPPERYQLSFTKPDYIWMEGNEPMTLFAVDARHERQAIVVSMKPAAKLLATLFPELMPKEQAER